MESLSLPLFTCTQFFSLSFHWCPIYKVDVVIIRLAYLWIYIMWMRMYLCTYIYVYIYIRIYILTYTCVRIDVCVYVWVCVSVYMYIYICVCLLLSSSAIYFWLFFRAVIFVWILPLHLCFEVHFVLLESESFKNFQGFFDTMNSAEAATKRCSLEKMFWKYAANLQ